MSSPDPLETVTVRGNWVSPLGGEALSGWAQLAAVATVRAPDADVVLTTLPDRQDLVAGAAQWADVVLSDATELAEPLTYRLRVRSTDGGYREDRLVQFFASAVVDGVIRLEDVADATPAPSIVTYLLASELGQPGGPAGPLDGDGLVPTAQLPIAGGSQPADADLTAIAGLSPANDDVIQRIAGAWTNRTPSQLKTSLVLTKGDVGLGNVDNTTDAGKPVSAATQAALDLKAPLASPTFTGTVAGISKTMVGLGSVDNTADTAKPVSTAQQAALDLKAPLASPTFTGTLTTPRLITPPQVLVDAATIATDASLANHFRVTLGGNRTLGNPTNPTDGQKVIWELVQDGAGNRTITLDAAFALGTDLSAVTLSSAAGKRDLLGALYHAGLAKWLVIALVRGY